MGNVNSNCLSIYSLLRSVSTIRGSPPPPKRSLHPQTGEWWQRVLSDRPFRFRFSRKKVPDWDNRPVLTSGVQISLNNLRLSFTECCFNPSKIVQKISLIFFISLQLHYCHIFNFDISSTTFLFWIWKTWSGETVPSLFTFLFRKLLSRKRKTKIKGAILLDYLRRESSPNLNLNCFLRIDLDARDVFVTSLRKNVYQTLHKKWSFPSRISSVNVTKSAIFLYSESCPCIANYIL